jgi:hypothetical protein
VRPTQCAEQAAAYAANEPFALAVVDGQASNVGARSLSAHLSEQPRAVRVIVLVDSSTPCPSLAASDRDFRVETRVDSANNGPNAYKRVARLHSWRELEHAVHEAFEADRLAEENVAAEAVFA